MFTKYLHRRNASFENGYFASQIFINMKLNSFYFDSQLRTSITSSIVILSICDIKDITALLYVYLLQTTVQCIYIQQNGQKRSEIATLTPYCEIIGHTIAFRALVFIGT